MQEERMKHSSPEEQKISDIRNLYYNSNMDEEETEILRRDVKRLLNENRILRENINELQGQIQSSYKRIKELTEDNEQMELDV
tara:strand:+ start:566 stop:814 length:249 start_codon:yes stop_codon:yes gene_type:complete